MVKPKKANLVQNKNVALEKQLVQGKISKRKNKDKFHLRAEESSVSKTLKFRKVLILVDFNYFRCWIAKQVKKY